MASRPEPSLEDVTGSGASGEPAPRSAARWAVLLALLLAGTHYALFARQHVNLADGGFLWYGVERVRAGDVPLRDFKAYEPGRYWWCAPFGEGLLGVRRGLAAFQALGLALGLLVLTRAFRRPGWLLLAALVPFLWMFPRHKLFESGLAMATAWVGLRVLETSSLRSALLAGVYVGVAGVFGRNHGLYATLGIGLLLVVRAWRLGVPALPRHLVRFAGGVLLGVSPLFALMLFAPGYAGALLENVLFFARQGSNVPLPYPWPWTGTFSELPAFERVALYAAFLLPFGVLAAGAAALLRLGPDASSARRGLVACALVGLFTLHQVSVRSDPAHLGQAVHPLLLGALLAPAAFLGRRGALTGLVLAGLLALLTVLAVPASSQLWSRFRLGAEAPALQPLDVRGERFEVDAGMADYLTRSTQLLQSRVPADEPLFVAPYFSIFYPLLGREAPVWNLYFLNPAPEDAQRALIEELADVDWVWLADVPMFGPERTFRATHPLVFRHLEEEFEALATPFPNHALLRRRER